MSQEAASLQQAGGPGRDWASSREEAALNIVVWEMTFQTARHEEFIDIYSMWMSISRLLAEGDESIIYTSGRGVKMRPGTIIFTLPSSTPG